MTQLQTQSEKQKTYDQNVLDVRNFFLKERKRISVVLPKEVPVDRFLRLAITAITNKPMLLDCNRQSLFASVVQAAQLGLELDPVLGQASMSPFKGRVTLIPGYKGIADLARRSDKVVGLGFNVVHEGDEFDWDEGSKPFVHHKKQLAPLAAREVVAAYARAELRGAVLPQIVVMARWELDRIMNMTNSKKDGVIVGPWKDHTASMQKKTALKQLGKLLPLSVALRRAIAIDDQSEIGTQDLEKDLPDILSGGVIDVDAETVS